MNNAMIMTLPQAVLTIALVAAATLLTRFLPYIAFPEGKKIPKYVLYLGKVLAPAVFGLLVIYCLRNTDIVAAPHGLPELISLIAVVLLYKWRHDMVAPLIGGTVCYMILIRIM
ncbi:MAG: AzlD domain-containing protein [Lachnospiraceae bacterium]|nr:AzlD domain-containing protein [Lachnospiraceae bacterium]